jgi:hypothetical protein
MTCYGDSSFYFYAKQRFGRKVPLLDRINSACRSTCSYVQCENYSDLAGCRVQIRDKFPGSPIKDVARSQSHLQHPAATNVHGGARPYLPGNLPPSYEALTFVTCLPPFPVVSTELTLLKSLQKGSENVRLFTASEFISWAWLVHY